LLNIRPHKNGWHDANCQELQRLGTEDVHAIDAKHLCVNSRGISDIEIVQ
jgi:hypothetical protein